MISNDNKVDLEMNWEEESDVSLTCSQRASRFSGTNGVVDSAEGIGGTSWSWESRC